MSARVLLPQSLARKFVTLLAALRINIPLLSLKWINKVLINTVYCAGSFEDQWTFPRQSLLICVISS